MDATLNVVTKILAYADQQVNSQPRLRFVDWVRDISGIPVRDPLSSGHQVAGQTAVTIFNGTRATTLDGTTAFSVALLPLTESNRYRFTWTGGTNPTLRTGRGLTPTGILLTLTVNPNATLTVVAASPLFGSVLVGDEVFIPHTTTGDAANVFSVLNAGYWQVLSVTSTTQITLVRPAGQDFEGASEAVTPASNSQLRAYSAAGVLIGDSADITAGFNLGTRKTFDVLAVTDAFFEVLSTTPLATESGITPGATGLVFFSDTTAGNNVAVRILDNHLQLAARCLNLQFEGDWGIAAQNDARFFGTYTAAATPNPTPASLTVQTSGANGELVALLRDASGRLLLGPVLLQRVAAPVANPAAWPA